jgi:hypothetical protein
MSVLVSITPNIQVTSPPQSSNTEIVTVESSTSASSVSDRDGSCSEKDKDSLWEKDRCESRASSSTSAATLTNVSGSNFIINLLI